MSKPHVLVVEDERRMIILIKYNLEMAGFAVNSAMNGQEALDYCAENDPDLIICDIMMPVMNGLEFRESLLKSSHYRGVPFIFLTARAQASDILRGQQLGVEEYLTKPFQPEDLIAKVSNILLVEQN